MSRYLAAQTVRALVTVLAIAALVGYEARAAEFQQIAPDLFFNYDFEGSNSVVLITEEGVLIVDTRMHPRDAELLLEEIRERTDAPIRWVINSQFHGDHYMGNSVFKQEGATIIAHYDTQTIIEEKFEFEVQTRNFEQRGYDRDEIELVLPDILFDRRLTLELGGRTTEILYLGAGQNKGDTLIYFPHAKALHTGGVFHNRSWANTSYTPSIEGWIQVLRNAKAIGAEIYLPPHGPVATAQDLDEFTTFINSLYTGVQDAVDSGASLEQMLAGLTFGSYRGWRGYERRDRNLTAVYELLTVGKAQYFVPGGQAQPIGRE